MKLKESVSEASLLATKCCGESISGNFSENFVAVKIYNLRSSFRGRL